MVDVRTNVYGLARSLLAAGTLLTLSLNPIETLLSPLGEDVSLVETFGSPLYHLSLFTLLGPERWEMARWLAVSVLLLVAIGWRPRVTGLMHWWVSFSYTSSAVIIDGGDHIATVLTGLLAPVCLVDSRRWHWQPVADPASEGFRLACAETCWWAIRLQVAIVYLEAAIAKMAVDEWANGTALYYWFTAPVFGVPSWLAPLILPIVTHPWGVVLLTWGVIILELALFACLLADRRVWPVMFWVGLSFHFGIILTLGLGSFSFAMAGALVLYLLHPQSTLSFPRWIALRWLRLSASGRKYAFITSPAGLQRDARGYRE